MCILKICKWDRIQTKCSLSCPFQIHEGFLHKKFQLFFHRFRGLEGICNRHGGWRHTYYRLRRWSEIWLGGCGSTLYTKIHDQLTLRLRHLSKSDNSKRITLYWAGVGFVMNSISLTITNPLLQGTNVKDLMKCRIVFFSSGSLNKPCMVNTMKASCNHNFHMTFPPLK